MQPHDLFDESLTRFIITKHNGFDVCWLFMGEPSLYAGARRKAWVHANPNNPKGQGLGTSCGYDECIYPFHLYSGKSEVGRMFFILENSERQGKCLIWQGQMREGVPQIRQAGARNFSWVTVRRFTYEQEYNVELLQGDRIGVSCENQERCVEPRHLKLLKERPSKPGKKRRRCANDKHNLRDDRVTCHVCKI